MEIASTDYSDTGKYLVKEFLMLSYIYLNLIGVKVVIFRGGGISFNIVFIYCRVAIKEKSLVFLI